MSTVELPHACENMLAAVRDSRIPVVYYSKFREYGILIDGGPATLLMEYCPWDGTKLPRSLRNEYFDLVHGMGLELESKNLPREFTSDEWWRTRGID